MDSDSANGQSGPGRDDPLEAAMAVAGPPAHGREYAAAAVQAAGIQEAPNPLNVEHALSVLKDQLSTLVELQYFDPKKKNEPSKRLSNLLRPYRAALLELEDFVRASHDEDRAAQRTISSYLHLELTDGLVALNAVQAMQDVSVALGFEPSHIEPVQSVRDKQEGIPHQGRALGSLSWSLMVTP